MPYIASDGARIAYDVSGSGPAVVLLHSTAASRAQWDSLRRALSDQYTTVAIDLLGHGESDPWPGHRAITLADEAAGVMRVIDEIGGSVHLVGHSYGGAVALKVALTCERLASLVLVEPVSFHLLREGSAFDVMLLDDVAPVAEAVRTALATGDLASGLRCFVDYWNGTGTWDAMRPERRQALCRTAGTVALNFAAPDGEPARLDDCALLRLPTLVVAGERTPRPTARIAARLATMIPGAECRIVAGAGHMLPRTHSAIFLDALRLHLGRATTGRARVRRLAAA